jgi:hypothetical protein
MKPRWPTTLTSKSSAIARKACGLLLVLIALSSPAIARQGQNNNQDQNNNNQGKNVSAPEIDPGALSGAVTLLVSGTLILTDRLRRK